MDNQEQTFTDRTKDHLVASQGNRAVRLVDWTGARIQALAQRHLDLFDMRQ